MYNILALLLASNNCKHWTKALLEPTVLYSVLAYIYSLYNKGSRKFDIQKHAQLNTPEQDQAMEQKSPGEMHLLVHLLWNYIFIYTQHQNHDI